MTAMFGWLCMPLIPSFVGYSFLVMLLVLPMGLREFVHKLSTECYQHVRLRPPPDPDFVTPLSVVSEGGPHKASEGARSINVIFCHLCSKLMGW